MAQQIVTTEKRSLSMTARKKEDLRASFAEIAKSFPDRLKKHVAGTQELSSAQLKAIDMVLSRVLPTLQSIDQQVTTRPFAGMTEGQLLDRLAAIVARSPELATTLASKLNTKGVTIEHASAGSIVGSDAIADNREHPENEGSRAQE